MEAGVRDHCGRVVSPGLATAENFEFGRRTSGPGPAQVGDVMLKYRIATQIGLFGLAASTMLLIACESRTESNVTPTKNTSTGGTSATATPVKQDSASRSDAASTPSSRDKRESVADTAARRVRGGESAERPTGLTLDTSSTTQDPALLPATLEVDPPNLDLGDIATGDSGVGAVVIRNTGNEAITIETIKCSCGCTSAKLAPNTVLEPGSEREVEVRLKGGTRAAVLTKTCRFMIKDQRPVVMQVRGNAIAFVEAAPRDLDPNVHTDGKLVFTSVDGEPFRITSMNPNIIADFPSEPRSSIEINFPYERWREMNAQPKVIFYTDHPKCEMVYVGVRRTAADIERIRNTVERDPATKQTRPDLPASKPDLEQRVRTGDTQAILNEIASGELEVEAQNQTGMTLLAMASKYGQLELMEGLLVAGADIEAPNRNGHTPLMQAAQTKNAEAVRLLLDNGANVDATDRLNGTAMSMAATYGSPEIVQELLYAGGRVNVVQNLTGFTPLIWASIAGDPNVIPLLIEAGADIEHGDLLEGATPVIHASRTGKIETVRHLLEAGADINARDRNGKTAFLSAVKGAASTPEKLRQLIELGADPYLMDNRGKSALDFAQDRTDVRGEAVRQYVEELFANRPE